jgi:glycosyltransferase involved in cell wall biosynthesis
LHIAHLSPSYLPILGGTEVYVDNLSSCLTNHKTLNDIVTLCVTRKWENSARLYDNVVHARRVLVWPSYRIGPLKSALARALRIHYFPVEISLLKEHLDACDILHFHDEVDLSFPAFVSRIGKPRVFTLHSIENTFNYFKRNRLARKILLESADLFHVFSTSQRGKLQELGIEDDDIFVIPNGVDISQFKPAIRRPFRKAIRIVWLGRIERGKGLINLLKAIRLLKSTGTGRHDIEVRIGGIVWDHRYYEELLDYKRQKELNEVRFSGPVDRALSGVFFRQADIFVLPSLRESFPIVNLEAMASGLPVVASAVGGVPEAVVDGETGFLVPANDPESIAEKVSLLVTDDKLRRRMGRKARETAEEYYSIEAVATKILALYQELT